MRLLTRRGVLAAAGTLASPLIARKPLAAEGLPAAKLTVLAPPVAAPNIAFVLQDGTERRLSEFEGNGMVLNFWATWCAPCIAEMPALAALSRTLAPYGIAVMPLSSDRGGAAVIRRFFDEHGLTALPVLLDPKGAAARAFKVEGIPATIVIDKKGRMRARLDGAADWSRAEIAGEIRQLVG